MGPAVYSTNGPCVGRGLALKCRSFIGPTAVNPEVFFIIILLFVQISRQFDVFWLLTWSMQSDNMFQVVEIFQIWTLEYCEQNWVTAYLLILESKVFLLMTFAYPVITVFSILPLWYSPCRSSLKPHPAGLGASLKQSLLTPASVSVPFLRIFKNKNYKTQTGGIGTMCPDGSLYRMVWDVFSCWMEALNCTVGCGTWIHHSVCQHHSF